MGAWLGDGPREPAPGWGRALASQTSPVATELAGRSPALAGLCPLPEAFLLLFSCAARKIPPWLSWAKPQLHLRAREALRLVQVSCRAETCAVPTVPCWLLQEGGGPRPTAGGEARGRGDADSEDKGPGAGRGRSRACWRGLLDRAVGIGSVLSAGGEAGWGQGCWMLVVLGDGSCLPWGH